MLSDRSAAVNAECRPHFHQCIRVTVLFIISKESMLARQRRPFAWIGIRIFHYKIKFTLKSEKDKLKQNKSAGNVSPVRPRTSSDLL